MTAPMERLSQSSLDDLWVRMAGMFGRTWISQYGASPTGAGADTWATTLAGFSRRQIKLGLSTCLLSGAEWPPSAPRFRAMCLGVPSLASVKYAMRTGATPTPFTRLVWQYFDARAEVEDHEKDKLVRDAYQLACDHVARGDALPEDPVAAIGSDRHKKRNPNRDEGHTPFQGGKEAFAELAKRVGIRLDGSAGEVE